MACCPSFRMCTASLIHLVKCSGSLLITIAWDQLMTWFSWVAWLVRTDLLYSVKLDTRKLLVNVRLVLDSTSVLCFCNLTPNIFQFHRFRSCHNWQKELCTHILLRLPDPVCLWDVPVHPFFTQHLPVVSIGRTEYQLLLTKGSDRGRNVKFQVIILVVWWI